MKKTFASLALALWLSLCCVAGAAASEGGYAWDKFPAEKLTDMAALQNGAKLFVNYCLSCHSAAYMRYNRLRDIGLTEDQIKKNLLFATEKVGDTMKAALDPKQVAEWLAAKPPDLSLIARSRAELSKGAGADYLYTYLRSYYRDDSTATGWNNLAFPGVAMPNVLWELQGQRGARFTDEKNPHNPAESLHVFSGFEQISPGTEDEHQFDESVGDLVAYLQWMGEPAQAKRAQVGVWVLIFLSLLTVFAWRLNAAYWKDVK